MIVLDSETTGLLGASLIPLSQKPHILEFAGIKLDDWTLKEVGRLTFLVKPPVAISAEITKITGIDDKMVMKKKPFVAYFPAMVDFFLGERTLVAHNAPYDTQIIANELERLGRPLRFPWPPNHICTAELTQDLRNKYLKQEELYQIVTGNKANQTHRAEDDVEQLVTVVRWLRKEGRL